MGFVDWLMHGLGFEGDGGKKGKKSKVDVKDDKYADFNLHEKVAGETNNPETITKTTQTSSGGFPNFGVNNESNIIMVEPKSQSDIQQVVDYLRDGQMVTVNLEQIANDDRMRILDFLSGALYGLNGSIHRWHGDLFLLAPEGHKILKKSDKE